MVNVELSSYTDPIGLFNAGKWKNKLDIAVKTLRVGPIVGQMTDAEFVDEAKRMHQLRHRNLVQLLGICSSESPLLIITELMVNGALLKYLRATSKGQLQFKELLDMAAQVTWH